MNVRPGTANDVRRIAELHATRITEGFLPTLGRPFLERLYRRILVSPDAFVLVAAQGEEVVGFAAGALDLGALYKRFVLRDGLIAGLRSAPRILRSTRRVIETLRYPASTEHLPEAEILAVAVDPAAGGRGIGRELVNAAKDELLARGVHSAKVVAGAENEAALRLYRGCGFAPRVRLTVHEGITSEVLVWSSS